MKLIYILLITLTIMASLVSATYINFDAPISSTESINAEDVFIQKYINFNDPVCSKYSVNYNEVFIK